MSILTNTLTYKFYNTFKTFFKYLKTKHKIGKIFYSEGFSTILYKYLNIDLREDWLGRLYGVVNPSINKNGEFDVSTMIIEIDGDQTNNNDYVKTWVYKQMKLIAALFKIDNLYDYIDIEFKHVGPDNQDNYLLIFDIADRIQMAIAFKKFIKHLFIYILLFGLGILGYFIFA